MVFRDILENKQFFPGDYLLNTDTGRPERIFAYPVYGILGDVQAAIYVNLALETLHRRLGELNLPFSASGP